MRKENLESASKIKISLGEFLPSLTISGDQSSTTSTNRTNQSGSKLSDDNLNLKTTISLEQKFFQVLKV